jgi:hypothetical protein
MKTKLLLLITVALSFALLTSCISKAVTDMPQTGKTDAAETENTPEWTPELELDPTLERTKKFTFQESVDVVPQPLNELDEQYVLRYILEREVFGEDIVQGYYRSTSPESYETAVHSYIEIGGKKYDVGQVCYGEDNTVESDGTRFYRLSLSLGDLDAAYKTIYVQYKSYGAKYVSTAYYIIEDDIPKFIYEIIGVDEYYHYDDSGVYSISSTDYHVPFNEYVIYKFDLENEKILFTNLLTFFDCDGVEFDKYRRLFFTCRKGPDDEIDAGPEFSERGNVYTFDNGEFVLCYTPV